MGNPNEAPPPPFDGVTKPRSTLPQAVPHSQDYEVVHNFPPSQPNAPNVQSFPLSQPNAPNAQSFPRSQPNVPNAGVQFAPNPPPFNEHTSSPMPFIQPSNQLPTQLWKTGLFDCMQDPTNAIITACFPCVTFGQIAELADSGNTSCATSGMLYSLISYCIAMPCIMSCTYRTKIRTMFGLVESPAPDWVVHCFCECCALCQEYRELKERGYDPTIGWAGNLAIQRQMQASMAPPMHQRMM